MKSLRGLDIWHGSCWTMMVLLLALGAEGYGQNSPCTATNAGLNTVYNSTSTTPSVALIDASIFSATNGNDVCKNIQSALTQLHNCHPVQGATEGIVDARGVPGLPMTCTVDPFAIGTTTKTTVLLPAGTIPIQIPWVLPANTRLIGQGPQVTKLTLGPGFNGIDMIEMGGVTVGSMIYCSGSTLFYNCQGIQIEHLGLDGSGSTGPTNGIVNQFAEELSFVNDVALDNLSGTALVLKGGANGQSTNSGPYTGITSHTSLSTSVCVSIDGGNTSGGFADTRGIHGLSCVSTASPMNTAAVTLDGSNNSLEDVYISGYADGVKIGSKNPAQNNVLMNVSGTNVTSLIHIANTANSVPGTTGFCPSPKLLGTGTYNVCDTTIIAAGITSGGTYVILDDLTGTMIATSATASVGLYALGEQVSVGNLIYGYSRYTTSSAQPAWYSYAGAPPISSGTCIPGSLFSNTTNATTALWGCATPSLSGSTWYRIK